MLIQGGTPLARRRRLTDRSDKGKMLSDQDGMASANPRGDVKLSQALLEERLQEATMRGEQLSKEGTPGPLANLEVLQRPVGRMVGQLEGEIQRSERNRGLEFYKSAGAKQAGESFRPTAGLGSATPAERAVAR